MAGYILAHRHILKQKSVIPFSKQWAFAPSIYLFLVFSPCYGVWLRLWHFLPLTLE